MTPLQISIPIKDLKRDNIGRSNSIELSCSKKIINELSSLSFVHGTGGLSTSSCSDNVEETETLSRGGSSSSGALGENGRDSVFVSFTCFCSQSGTAGKIPVAGGLVVFWRC